MTISIRGENKLKLSVTPTECFGDVLPPKKPFYFSKSITFLGTNSEFHVTCAKIFSRMDYNNHVWYNIMISFFKWRHTTRYAKIPFTSVKGIRVNRGDTACYMLHIKYIHSWNLLKKMKFLSIWNIIIYINIIYIIILHDILFINVTKYQLNDETFKI